jgi:hypothetical protein
MRRALQDFESSLRRIRTLADHVASDTDAILRNSGVRELHETQLCGSVVLLVGYFEAFLKELVRRFIHGLSSSGIPFQSLPDTIRNSHFEGGGRVLTKASQAIRKGRPTPFGTISCEDIVERLHSASSGASPYEILWEAFADTQASPGAEVVKAIAQNLGVKQFWPSVSRQSGASRRWTETTLPLKLDELIAKRNEVAHTGTSPTVPTTQEVVDFAEMLAALSVGLVAVLEAQLKTHSGSVAGTASVPSAAASTPLPSPSGP